MIEQARQEWPLHTNEAGEIECPACKSTDCVDTGQQPTDNLDSMGISAIPNAHECQSCGNVFFPVDALEHPMRSIDVLPTV